MQIKYANVKTIQGRVKRKIYQTIHECLIKNYDPVIEMEIWGHKFKLPSSHALPATVSSYNYYALNIGRIAKYLSSKYEDLSIIDVGGNIGDTVVILRNYISEDINILSIEGDRFYYNLLNNNTKMFKNIQSANYLLGEINEYGKKSLKTHFGTGHIVVDTSNGAKNTKIYTLSSVLKKDKFKLFRSSKLLKIDTDGYDFKIIRGAMDFIKNTKPIIFFEYDVNSLKIQDEDSIQIFNLLQNLGYSSIIIYDNYGIYFLSLNIDSLNTIDELNRYLNFSNISYYDLCLFHKEDEDMFFSIIGNEKKLFNDLNN